MARELYSPETPFCAGLLVLLHHELTMNAPLPWRVQVHVPVRKRVQCRTRDLHQSLLVKLNRWLSPV